jgi:hypothetical protein
MIAEMTRAFNVGFGLGVHGIGGTPTSGSNSQAEGNPSLDLIQTPTLKTVRRKTCCLWAWRVGISKGTPCQGW